MKPHGRKWRGKKGWRAFAGEHGSGPCAMTWTGGYRKRAKA